MNEWQAIIIAAEMIALCLINMNMVELIEVLSR
jgi:hypothetical protein